MTERTKKQPSTAQHPFPVRAFHTVNIIAVTLMAASGMQIYNATPVFGGKGGWAIPQFLVLGGWLAGGRHWHFAIMWLFFLNLLVYFVYLIYSHRWKTRFATTADGKAAIGKSVAGKRRLYAYHRILYSTVVPVMVFALLSGVAMYKPVQFDWLANAAGSWQNLRVIHFVTVPFLIVFTLIHSILGLKVGGLRLLRSIFGVG